MTVISSSCCSTHTQNTRNNQRVIHFKSSLLFFLHTQVAVVFGWEKKNQVGLKQNTKKMKFFSGRVYSYITFYVAHRDKQNAKKKILCIRFFFYLASSLCFFFPLRVCYVNKKHERTHQNMKYIEVILHPLWILLHGSYSLAWTVQRYSSSFSAGGEIWEECFCGIKGVVNLAAALCRFSSPFGFFFVRNIAVLLLRLPLLSGRLGVNIYRQGGGFVLVIPATSGIGFRRNLWNATHVRAWCAQGVARVIWL